MTERVVDIVSAVLDVPRDTLDASSSPDTLAVWDSLRHVQLVLALEESFGVQFAVDEIEAMQSVGVIAALLEARLSNPE